MLSIFKHPISSSRARTLVGPAVPGAAQLDNLSGLHTFCVYGANMTGVVNVQALLEPTGTTIDAQWIDVALMTLIESHRTPELELRGQLLLDTVHYYARFWKRLTNCWCDRKQSNMMNGPRSFSILSKTISSGDRSTRRWPVKATWREPASSIFVAPRVTTTSLVAASRTAAISSPSHATIALRHRAGRSGRRSPTSSRSS